MASELSSRRAQNRQMAREMGPPRKRMKYVPGGPGGGGRWDVDLDDEDDIVPVARRATERPSRRSMGARSPTASASRPRRDRPPARPRYSNSADAAAAISQNDNKPREERGWEEFHPDLDIDLDLQVFTADEVDGRVKPADLTKALHAIDGDNDKTPRAVADVQDHDENAPPDDDTPRAPHQADEFDAVKKVSASTTPLKKRPGRPPRGLSAMLNGLGSPPTPRIEPSIINSKDEKLKLTKASFRRVEFEKEFEQSKDHASKNYVDGTMIKVGYQETDRVPEPDKYVYARASEGSIEEELDFLQALEAEAASSGHVVGRVEYDMDEQDEVWLNEINARRKVDGQEPIKPAHFEFTMTQIEKEWHALEKRIPKAVPKPPQTHRPRSSSAAAVNGEVAGEEQDSKCAICDDGDCENTNAIVFCDGCDLAVHQECYGVPFIPEGQWLCRKCQLMGRLDTECVFCPHTDGAFKQTSNGKWAHLLCAIWIPEVQLGNTTFMEPVMDVEKVPKSRWKLHCYICQARTGACIQCGNKNCYQAFHVSCARKAKLYLKMKSQHGQGSIDASVLKAFCDKHVPKDWREDQQTDAYVDEAKYTFRKAFQKRNWGDPQRSALEMTNQQLTNTELDGDAAEGPNSKRKKEKIPKNVWRLPSGAPVVPQAVYEKIEAAIVKFNIKQKKNYVAEACKYWTLKREARRGAALLKRLQLQMDTFSSMEITRRNFAAMGAAGGPKLTRRIEFAERLEQDMDRVLELCERIKEREEAKLQDAEVLKSLVDTVYFPIPPLLWPILERAQTLDNGAKDDGAKFFKDGLREIQQKLEARLYTSAVTFATDLQQVFAEAIALEVASDPQASDNLVAQNTFSKKQKDMRTSARRINRYVQPKLVDVQRKEAELSGQTLDLPDHVNVDSMFEKSLRAQQGAISYSVNGDFNDRGTEAGHMSPSKATSVVNTIETNGVEETVPKATAGDQSGHGPAEDVDMLDEAEAVDLIQADPTAKHDSAINDKDETTDDAIIRLQLEPGSVTIPIANDDPDPPPAGNNGNPATSVSSSNSAVTAPTLSTSDSTNPSLNATDPLTPPHHINGASNESTGPLHEGGVMWYLDAFAPSGTTVHDELWGGRDALREMSEELSELGSEALEDLIDPNDAMDVDVKQQVDGASDPNGHLAPPVPQKKAKKKAKRSHFGRRAR